MNTEKLKKANELQAYIESLQSHKRIVIGKEENPFTYKDSTATMFVEPTCNNDKRKLLSKFLPFQLDKFMRIYLQNIDEEIEKLQKEFENL